MIPTRDELIERANGALHSGIPRTIYEVMADFALAEIRRAVADELYHLDSRAPNEPTLDVGDFRDGVEEERSQWRHDIHQRAEALRAEQAEHDKPGAGQETPRRSGDAPERSDPPPALNPTTATHNSSARVTYQAEPMSDADALDKAAEILRTNGLMVSAEHLKSEAAKLRAPKLVLAARRGAGAHRKMQHARHHARDGQGRPLRTPPQGAGAGPREGRWSVTLCALCGSYFVGAHACSTDASATSASRERPRVHPRTCAWSRADEDTDLWEGSCGVAWSIPDGTPAENGMNYCPRCGAKLETQQPKEST